MISIVLRPKTDCPLTMAPGSGAGVATGAGVSGVATGACVLIRVSHQNAYQIQSRLTTGEPARTELASDRRTERGPRSDRRGDRGTGRRGRVRVQ